MSTNVVVLASVLAAYSTALHAKLDIAGGSSNTRMEQCSATLNEYLSLRHNNTGNKERLNELEERAAVICKGYQVQLENNGDQVIGVIR